jgi:hypothetical protein
MSEVRILNASLEDDDETDQVIIRGVIDQESLKYIRLDWYQREQGFSNSHTNQIIGSYFSGSKVADITIGMRGQRVRSSKDTYMLLDKCFCIDGGQRLHSAGAALRERPDLKISLGAKVYTNTTEDFENELFCRLGTTQVKIGPSILIRNRRKKSRASAMMLALTKTPEFALKDRIAWDQRKTRHELIAGYTFARVVGALHAHKGGALRSTRPYDLLDGLDSLVARIGEESVSNNVIRFFDGIDKCWTLRQLSGARDEPRPHLRPPFLLTLARLFSGYTDFWDGKERNDFYFLDKFVRRLKGFTLNDYVTPRAKVPLDALYEILRKRLGLNPNFEQEAAE